MNTLPIPEQIIEGYGLKDFGCEFLASSGGFSGAQFWKFTTADRQYCLRRWPPQHPNRERLEWMHRVLVHTRVDGLDFVAVPRPIAAPGLLGSSTYVVDSGHFWELTDWMPGQANFHQDPNDERLRSAMISLARFHKSAAAVNLGFEKPDSIRSRIAMLAQSSAVFEQLAAITDFSFGDSIYRLHQTVLSPAVRRHAGNLLDTMRNFEDQIVPIQPVIRDIWHDHVLFSNNEVTGIVDFGAMRLDTISCDLSRLLGSLIGDDETRWEFSLDAYSTERPLTESERLLIPALDRSSVILGALHWLDWILIQGREFESRANVDMRLEWLIRRLHDLG